MPFPNRIHSKIKFVAISLKSDMQMHFSIEDEEKLITESIRRKGVWRRSKPIIRIWFLLSRTVGSWNQ